MKTEIQKLIEAVDFSVSIGVPLTLDLETLIKKEKARLSLCENGIERGYKLAINLTSRDYPTLCFMGGLWMINKILTSPTNESEKRRLNNLILLFPSIISVIPDGVCFQGYPAAYEYLSRKVPDFTCHENSSDALFHVIY